MSAAGAVARSFPSSAELAESLSNELHQLMPGAEEEQEQSAAGRAAVSSSRRRRLAAGAAAATCAAVLVLAAVSWTGRPAGLRAASWSREDHTSTELFNFHLGDRLEKFADEMRGLTGTCLTGRRCAGNPRTTMQSCDSDGTCTQLKTAFCCEKPESKISTTVGRNGEVTCKCSTTSKALRTVESKFKSLEDKPRKVLDKLRAITGQCLVGEKECASAALRAHPAGRLFCCPAQFKHITTGKVGLTLTCHCS